MFERVNQSPVSKPLFELPSALLVGLHMLRRRAKGSILGLKVSDPPQQQMLRFTI
jgi:hypothetical protein